MRKYSNFEIIQIVEILHSFENKKIPFDVGYAIAKNLKIFYDEYNIYTKQLNKIFEEYKEHFLKDDNGSIKINEKMGIPMVDDESKMKYIEDINKLLSFNASVEPYLIDEIEFKSALKYDANNKEYEVLAPKDIYKLMNILCPNAKDDSK